MGAKEQVVLGLDGWVGLVAKNWGYGVMGRGGEKKKKKEGSERRSVVRSGRKFNR